MSRLDSNQSLKVEVSHTLDPEQLSQIAKQVYQTTIEAIEEARKISKVDSDILFSKNDLRRFLGNVSAGYLEELLADPTFPRGRILSERKQVFSKSEVKQWLLGTKKN